MNIRRVTSLTALLSFILILLTSIILYIVPEGRVAYWADWRLWGLTKAQWGDIHIINGLLFLISIFLHIYYNWTLIVNYLKNKSKEIKVFTKEFNLALVLTVVFTLGALVGLPPFQTVLDISSNIKDAAADKYGDPPYGHAELSTLRTFVKRQGIDLSAAMAKIKKNGVKFKDETQTLKDISRQNGMSPQQVYLAMKPDMPEGAAIKLPENPPSGLGRRTLADICQDYGLNVKVVERALAEKNMKATADMTMKAIAEKYNVGPSDVFEVLKNSAKATEMTAGVNSAKKGAAADDGASKGIGRMTLAQVCETYQMDQAGAIKKLADRGIDADPEDKMKTLAEKNGTSPFDLLEAMK